MKDVIHNTPKRQAYGSDHAGDLPNSFILIFDTWKKMKWKQEPNNLSPILYTPDDDFDQLSIHGDYVRKENGMIRIYLLSINNVHWNDRYRRICIHMHRHWHRHTWILTEDCRWSWWISLGSFCESPRIAFPWGSMCATGAELDPPDCFSWRAWLKIIV
jgi:hypothetical protein